MELCQCHDVHSFVFVDDAGQLKIVDAEVFTDVELEVQQRILSMIDGSQDGKAQGHLDAPRVLHSFMTCARSRMNENPLSEATASKVKNVLQIA